MVSIALGIPVVSLLISSCSSWMRFSRSLLVYKMSMGMWVHGNGVCDHEYAPALWD